MTHYTVRSIIDDLKLATSFVEAQNVLKNVQHLSGEARGNFSSRLKAVFNRSVDQEKRVFQIVLVEPLEDIQASDVPTFRIVAFNPLVKR